MESEEKNKTIIKRDEIVEFMRIVRFEDPKEDP
jgi:hypothetical protein